MPIISLKTGTKSRSLLVGNPYFVPSSFESIASATGTGSSGTITFSSIPSTYSHLQIRAIIKNSGTGTAANSIPITFNSDTGTNYSMHHLLGDGATAQADNGVSQNAITLRNSTATSNASYTNMLGGTIIDIIDYANTSKYKTIRAFSGIDYNNTSGGLALTSGLWLSTSAITSITFTASTNLTTTSTFALYGIKG